MQGGKASTNWSILAGHGWHQVDTQGVLAGRIRGAELIASGGVSLLRAMLHPIRKAGMVEMGRCRSCLYLCDGEVVSSACAEKFLRVVWASSGGTGVRVTSRCH